MRTISTYRKSGRLFILRVVFSVGGTSVMSGRTPERTSLGTILEQVRQVISEQLRQVPANELSIGTRFTDDLHLDGLDCIELVMAAEERFGIEISKGVYETVPRGSLKYCSVILDGVKLFRRSDTVPRLMPSISTGFLVCEVHLSSSCNNWIADSAA
jgi:acyl carrier protein